MTDPISHVFKSQTRLWFVIMLLAVGEVVLALCIGGCGDITSVDTRTQGDPASRGGATGKTDGGNPVPGSVDAGTNRNDASSDLQRGGTGGATGDAGGSVSETGDGTTSGAPDTTGIGTVAPIGQRCGNYSIKPITDYIACCRSGDDCSLRYGKRDRWCDCAVNPPADGFTTCEYKNGGVVPPEQSGSYYPTECVFTR